jgi:hypothetical protein
MAGDYAEIKRGETGVGSADLKDSRPHISQSELRVPLATACFAVLLGEFAIVGD